MNKTSPTNQEVVENPEGSNLPFILQFLETYEGAISPTTTGTYAHPDGADTA